MTRQKAQRALPGARARRAAGGPHPSLSRGSPRIKGGFVWTCSRRVQIRVPVELRPALLRLGHWLRGDPETGQFYVFLGQPVSSRTVGQVAAIYKARWQIELFWGKWVKQHLEGDRTPQDARPASTSTNTARGLVRLPTILAQLPAADRLRTGSNRVSSCLCPPASSPATASLVPALQQSVTGRPGRLSEITSPGYRCPLAAAIKRALGGRRHEARQDPARQLGRYRLRGKPDARPGSRSPPPGRPVPGGIQVAGRSGDTCCASGRSARPPGFQASRRLVAHVPDSPRSGPRLYALPAPRRILALANPTLRRPYRRPSNYESEPATSSLSDRSASRSTASWGWAFQ